MKRIRELEALLLRAEAAIAVVLVLVMLGLASYNVLYRNLLVPLQRHWAQSGPPIAAAPPPAAPTREPGQDTPGTPAAADDKSGAEGFAGDFGDAPEPESEGPGDKSAAEAFAGDFGDEPEPEPEPEPVEKAAAEGFAGDFGDAPEPEPEPEPVAGAGEGFAGDFGEPADPDAAAADLTFDSEGDDQDDQFDDLPMVDDAGEILEHDDEPEGGPPPAGSFAAWGVAFIDAIKLDWIDVLLRQLVIITSFFGAMIATQRRKHINIDALSKLLNAAAQRWVAAAVNLLAIVVCLVLASAGWDLVKIGHKYPKELLPWAEESTFQLMFPIGFGLLALHFAVRLLESFEHAPPPGPVPPPSSDAENGGDV